MKKIIPLAIVIIEFLITAYVAFYGYFLSGWFLDDGVAARLNNNDWYQIAITRALYAIVIALLISGISFILNKYIFSHFEKAKSNKKSLIISIMFFFIIVIPSLIGAIQFTIEKPFI